MTARRSLQLAWLVVPAAVAVAACTSGTTPVCDDAGGCLIAEPQDGSVVDSPVAADAPHDTTTMTDAAPEAAPEAAIEAAAEASPMPGSEGGAD